MSPEVGFFWHVHHDCLLEWCYSYEERARYIRDHKPSNEQALRLRLFQPVRGVLPRAAAEAERAFTEARLAVTEARRAFTEAERAFTEAERALTEAERALTEAERALTEAWRAATEAWRAAASDINALHAKECPDCPWNGKTIFTEVKP